VAVDHVTPILFNRQVGRAVPRVDNGQRDLEVS